MHVFSNVSSRIVSIAKRKNDSSGPLYSAVLSRWLLHILLAANIGSTDDYVATWINGYMKKLVFDRLPGLPWRKFVDDLSVGRLELLSDSQ